MLSFSKREDYAILFITKLAKQYGKQPVSLTSISRETKISLPFLRQIALSLRRGGLLKAFEGKNGGYQLIKTPSEISMGDVLEALEGKKLISCCNPKGEDVCPCHAKKDFLWRKLNRHYIKNYYRLTFDRLC